MSLVAVLISGSTAVYMALHGYGVWTLVVQGLLTNGINALLLWITSRWYPEWIFSWSSFKELFSFGSKILLGGLLHTIYVNLYTLVIGKVFPVREVGLYGKAVSLSQYLSTNITSIIVRVSYPVLCRLQDDNNSLTEKFYQFIRLTSFFVFPLMIGLAVLSESFIRIVLTDKWIDAVPYIQILCFAYMWDPVMRMSWDLLNVKHRSDYSLKSEVVKKVTALIILASSIPFGIKVMCMGLVFYALFDLIIILQFTKKILPNVTIENHLKNLLPLFFQSTLMGIGVYLFIQIFINPWFQLFGGIVLGFILYLILSYIISREEFKYIVKLVKKT
jgi:O-antigen/teichoic acid export membrane protein